MARDHPLLVQHSKCHTQAWRANGDISLILSKSGTENPSVDDIIATEKYITGYASRGNQSTGAIADSSIEMGILAQAFHPIFPHFSKLGPLFKKTLKILKNAYL